MKITLYELLGMVKDSKAPNNARIRYFDRHNDYYDECNLKENEIINRLHYGNIELNDTVEILEEPKGIPEKIEIYKDEEGHYFIDKHCKKIYITCDEVNFMVEEFNQLLDYLKSKGE